jgi:HAD superfamily hydrolase (TIGR01509 family)
MIKALIFDFDGLIIDTEICVFNTWQEIYREFGVELHFDDWAKCIGASSHLFDPYENLEQLIGKPVEREEIRKRERKRIDELVEKLPILPGVKQYLQQAKTLGLSLAIASSSPHGWVDPHLERLKLKHYFDTIRCRDDVAAVKPDPALYNLVLEDLGVSPEDAIVFEDSPNGILAAHRAGIFCVAVPNQLTRHLSVDLAGFIFESLEEINLKQLLKKYDRRMKMAKIIAFCGLNCDECPAYIATQKDDDAERKRVAKMWAEEFNAPELTYDKINCDGCLQTDGRLFQHCLVCNIRKCGMERELENCAFCDDFACDKLEEFFGFVPEAKVNLQELRRKAGLVE